ncbi:DUF2490 domain-containing protein [Moheibacter sediminis]|uniref:DUF2490 domain-containing protein n=1 Tax=Moheibacter sediminis TaxID=1434700 RepID=A0A1W1Z8W7_9FLAO|nr:DUF2490 domain-containing protein [Moheibacter sediminis]SMC44824.1 Protein of unknown function [Moheibacter sediminis]
MFKKIAILSLLFLSFFQSKAQDSDFGNWWIYFGNKQIDEKWNWHHEVQYRNYNFVGDLEQLLLRTGIGYNLTPNNNNILLGYAFIHSENYTGIEDEKINVNEHRIYQQFITKQSFWRFNLQHRYRFEQRFIEEDFKMRLRYFLALNFPLNQKEMLDKTAYLSAYNEIFINTKSDFFDRNRVFAGLGYKFNSNLRLEVGYMNQILNNFSRDQLNIMAFVTL